MMGATGGDLRGASAGRANAKAIIERHCGRIELERNVGVTAPCRERALCGAGGPVLFDAR
jgi:hypothetical protein